MDKEVTVCIYTYTILPFAIAWVDLEGIMLSEISRRKPNTVLLKSLKWNLKDKTD